MEINLEVETIKTDYQALQDGENISRGEPVFIVHFHPVVLTEKEYHELQKNMTAHEIKLKTEE